MKPDFKTYIEYKKQGVTEMNIIRAAKLLEQGGVLKLHLSKTTDLDKILLILEYTGFTVDTVANNIVTAIYT